jgi:hypothetical protein
MNKLKFAIYILTSLIFAANIYFVIDGINNKPIDSILTDNSILNLIMISRINQIIAFIFSVILLVVGIGNTQKEKQAFWFFIALNFLNAFAVFAVTKYLSMLNI